MSQRKGWTKRIYSWVSDYLFSYANQPSKGAETKSNSARIHFSTRRNEKEYTIVMSVEPSELTISIINIQEIISNRQIESIIGQCAKDNTIVSQAYFKSYEFNDDFYSEENRSSGIYTGEYGQYLTFAGASKASATITAEEGQVSTLTKAVMIVSDSRGRKIFASRVGLILPSIAR